MRRWTRRQRRRRRRRTRCWIEVNATAREQHYRDGATKIGPTFPHTAVLLCTIIFSVCKVQ